MLENTRAERLSLNGEWQIEIAGQSGLVQVPGVWELQGYPADAEEAVYTRAVVVPVDWTGAQIYLRFGAVSYRAEVVVNGIQVGVHEGLWTPFEYDITDVVDFGNENCLELRIVKSSPTEHGRYPYRDVLVGFLPYVATTFGGPWQDVELIAHRTPAIQLNRLEADRRTGEVTISVEIHGNVATWLDYRYWIEITSQEGRVVSQGRYPAEPIVSWSLRVLEPELWSPEHPALYTASLRLLRGDTVVTEVRRNFGFRELRAEGEDLLLNGERIHLRGVLSWGWNPRSLAPTPTDEEIRDEFRRVRALGFNLVKLCLFVPPQRLFDIADEEGMLLWLELPMWWQRMNDHLRRQVVVEYSDILREVHHHPTVVIYSLGCELDASMAGEALLAELDRLTRQATMGALICDNSGSGEAYQGLSFDYADFADYHFYCDLHYFVPLLDHFRRDWRPPRPWIFGEFCDKDDYRNPAALLEDGARLWWRDVLGVEGTLDRWAYSEQESRMAANSLPFTDAQLVEISRRESFMMRKVILERTRARREVRGYVVTGLRDTPISTSGMFDDAGQSKYAPAAFRQFNSDSVLLLDHGRARQWLHGGDRPAPTDLYNHFGGDSVTFRVILSHFGMARDGGDLYWQLFAPDGTVNAEGSMPVGKVSSGAPREVGTISLTLPGVAAAGAWQLAVDVGGWATNTWSLWIYPRLHLIVADVRAHDPVGAFDGQFAPADLDSMTQGIVIASAFTRELDNYLQNGGRAIVLQPEGGGLPSQGVPFWRESIKLLYDHPIMRAFPHEGHADLQFYHLATDHAFDSAAFQEMDVTPIMRRLDARLFTTLDYIVEARRGAGWMLASTLRFWGGAGDQVRGLATNPAGAFLLRQMIDYLMGA